MPKLHIATTREVGERCETWTRACGFELVSPEECDVYISILSSKILPPEFVKAHRCYNFHPAILPQYGGSPVFTMVILNRETESGVTLHEMDEGIDTGANISIGTFPLKETDTAEDVRERAEEMIYRMFQRWLFPLMDNTYRRVYKKRELGKDLTDTVRALTLDGKEPAFWVNSKGEKIYIKYE